MKCQNTRIEVNSRPKMTGNTIQIQIKSNEPMTFSDFFYIHLVFGDADACLMS